VSPKKAGNPADAAFYTDPDPDCVSRMPANGRCLVVLLFWVHQRNVRRCSRSHHGIPALP